MATKVEDASVEVDGRLALFAPQLAGLKDLSNLDTSPRAHEEILQSMKRYDLRIKLLNAVKDANTALLADGHPDLPLTQIDPAALASIRENAETVRLATATFTSNVPPPAAQASALNPTAGAVEPKP